MSFEHVIVSHWSRLGLSALSSHLFSFWMLFIRLLIPKFPCSCSQRPNAHLNIPGKCKSLKNVHLPFQWFFFFQTYFYFCDLFCSFSPLEGCFNNHHFAEILLFVHSLTRLGGLCHHLSSETGKASFLLGVSL